MKWVLSHASGDIHRWELQNENGSKSAILNLQRLSLRLSGTSKRLFFLDVQGFLHKKILLRTEYGVAIGETALADKASAGSLNLNGQKFFYHLKENGVLLYDNEKQAVASCELPSEAIANKLELFGLLFGLVWFSTADVAAERLLPATA